MKNVKKVLINIFLVIMLIACSVSPVTANTQAQSEKNDTVNSSMQASGTASKQSVLKSLAGVTTIGNVSYSTLQDAVDAAQPGDVIKITQNITLESAVTINNKSDITITSDSETETITRGAGCTGNMFAINSSKVTFENISLNGGAVWDDKSLTAEAAKNRINSGMTAVSGMIKATSSTLELKAATTISDADADLQNYDSVSAGIMAYGTVINMYEGAIIERITGYNSENFGGGILLESASTMNMYGGTIVGNSSPVADSNEGGAIFARSKSTLNMYNSAIISNNYSVFSAVLVRESIVNMYDNSTVSNNEGGFGAGILAYTSSKIVMNDQSTVSGNSSEFSGGGIYLTSNTGFGSSSSELIMKDSSSVTGNTAKLNGGGIFVSAGILTMLGNASVTNNSAATGGGIFLYSSGDAGVANLISGTISENSATGLGSAIYHKGTTLNLNAADFHISGTIGLDGTGTNIDAKTITLIGKPSSDETYTVETKTTDTFAGRDIVKPGSLTIEGTIYTMSDASEYFSNFKHTTMGVMYGSYYYATKNDTSHDTYLVLVDPYSDVTFSKQSADGKELAGAKLHVEDMDGNMIESWISDGSVHRMIGVLKAEVEYKLVEDSAPSGYTVAKSIDFTVNTDGTAQTVTMQDAPTDVTISKQSTQGTGELSGAKLEIQDQSGKTVESWTTGKTAKELVGELNAGESYTLVETEAPSGYTVAKSISFTVNTDGTAQTVTMIDDAIEKEADYPYENNDSSKQNTNGNETENTAKKGSLPKTGDSTNEWLWIIVCIVSASVLSGSVVLLKNIYVKEGNEKGR